MLPQEIIRKKRDKQELTKKEIEFFIKGITKGIISDAQIGALTMAIFLNGFDKQEIIELTKQMTRSGKILKWSADKPIIDKHSTGGVGDKVSLMLAPILAACGAFVPMISGRGLGHTGGTLDKFDSIKGYNTNPTNQKFRDTVNKIGCAIIGQTSDLAPADKKIYSIRDVCATVESIPLITASILSKKISAGLNSLIMDLKVGNGAFMDNIKDARELAKSIVDVANGAGLNTRAIITDMNQVLGKTVGNAIEVREAVKYLKNENKDERLHKVTIELCSEVLIMQNLAKDKNEAKTMIEKSLSSGQALEKFARMVKSLGGASNFTDDMDKYLSKAQIIKPIFTKNHGYVESMNTRNIGLSLISLKGGRTHPDQKLDYSTGFCNFCQIGDFVDNENPLCFIHANNEDDFEYVTKQIQKNIITSNNKPTQNKTIYEVIK